MLLLAACDSIAPTNIAVTGRMIGDAGTDSLFMTHDAAAESTPHVAMKTTSGTGNLGTLSIAIQRQGAAPAVGYELLAIVNDLSVGGGGLGGGSQGSAGDASFHLRNIGSLAKVSYYWFEDSGESAFFDLPAPGDISLTGSAWLARVRGNEEQVRVPFVDEVNDSDLFLDAACLTGGDDPCFDMATLAAELHASYGASFSDFADENMLVSLGGPAGDGNFRLDYIPALTVLLAPNVAGFRVRLHGNGPGGRLRRGIRYQSAHLLRNRHGAGGRRNPGVRHPGVAVRCGRERLSRVPGHRSRSGSSNHAHRSGG
jgi:hypothetical protein